MDDIRAAVAAHPAIRWVLFVGGAVLLLVLGIKWWESRQTSSSSSSGTGSQSGSQQSGFFEEVFQSNPPGSPSSGSTSSSSSGSGSSGSGTPGTPNTRPVPVVLPPAGGVKTPPTGSSTSSNPIVALGQKVGQLAAAAVASVSKPMSASTAGRTAGSAAARAVSSTPVRSSTTYYGTSGPNVAFGGAPQPKPGSILARHPGVRPL